MLWVERMHEFFGGLDLDLYDDDDEKMMYPIKDIMHQYLDIFNGVKIKDDLQQMFY